MPRTQDQTRRQRTRCALIASCLLLLMALACYGTTETTTLAPYSGHAVPPWWVCVPATPLPTATPQAPPWDWPTPEPGSTPLPWHPPGWPPTPQPTPTPYVITGGTFYLNQTIWIPIYSRVRAWQHEWIRLSVKDWSPLGSSPTHAEATCIAFNLNVRSFAGSPIDLDLPTMVYLSTPHTNAVYQATHAAFRDFGVPYPEARFSPDEERTVTVPICFPELPDPGNVRSHLRLGILASLFESRAGSAAVDGTLLTGSDTAFYVDFWSYDPHCSYPPAQGLYPEFSDPPLGVGNPIAGVLTRPMGGRYAPGVPVTVPPCHRITRGFGCSAFPTGVAGGERCPADQPYWHTGVDFACREGTPIYNVLDGYVRHWGWGGGYGNLVIIGNYSDSLKSYYAHLVGFAAPQPGCYEQGAIGDACHAGLVVGGVGTTGFSTGNHLHWEVRVHNVPVDPYLYFGTASAAPAGLDALRAAFRSAPALAAPPDAAGADAAGAGAPRYPLTVGLRDAEGQAVSGVTLHLRDLDGHYLDSCVFTAGQCHFELATGVYGFELHGTLPDGTPVDPYGQANIAARDSGLVEYHHGPLGIWHTGPATTAGLTLVREPGLAAAQPLLDQTPRGARPTPLDPRDWLPQPQPTPIPPSLSTPPGAPGAPSPALAQPRGRIGALVLLGLLILWIGAWALAAALQRQRRKGEP